MKKNKSLSLIIFGLLLILPNILCLHIVKHFTIDGYVSEMISQQSNVQEISKNIINLFDKARQNSQGNTIDQKIILLESTIKQQLQLLHRLQFNLTKPLKESTVVCPAFTNLQLLKQQKNDLKTTLSQLQESTVPSLSDSHSQQKITSQLKHANKQITYFEEVLSISSQQNPSTKLSSPEPTYLSNLEAKNWVYGNLSREALNAQYQNPSKKQFIVLCDIQTPFQKGDTCANCQQLQYFDLSKKVCIQCKNINIQEHKCEDKYGININVGANLVILPENTQLNDYVGDIMCPEQTPFFDNKQCINCPQEKPYFNVSSNTCTTCHENHQFKNNKCVKITKYITNLSEKQRIIFNQITIEQFNEKTNEQKLIFNLLQCPIQTPFYSQTQKKCVNCEQNLYFELSTSTCKQCGAQTFYSKKTFNCKKIPYYSNINAWLWQANSQFKTINEIKRFKEEQEGAIECGKETPFFNSQECIKCGQNQVFDFDDRQCITCGEQEYFSINLRHCMKSYAGKTNLESKNLLNNGYSKNAWYHYNIGEASNCPDETPYWDRYSCIACPQQAPYFNLGFLICQPCLSDSVYSEELQECVNGEQKIVPQGPLIESMKEYRLRYGKQIIPISEQK